MLGIHRSSDANKSYCFHVKERAKDNTVSIIFLAICIFTLVSAFVVTKNLHIPKGTSMKVIMPFFLGTVAVGIFVVSDTMGMCGKIFFNNQAKINNEMDKSK